MGRHMRNGRDYSRPGPKVDYELRKDSNNAARSGDVYDKIEEIQSQIVPTASIESGETASKAYSVGDFLVKDGILYKVTNAIVKDDALTVGTNIAMTTVSDELNSSDTFIKKTKLLGRSSKSNVVELNESFKNYDAIYVSSFTKKDAEGSMISTSMFAFSEDINVGDKITLLQESNYKKWLNTVLTISSETSFTLSSSEAINIEYYITVIGINL